MVRDFFLPQIFERQHKFSYFAHEMYIMFKENLYISNVNQQFSYNNIFDYTATLSKQQKINTIRKLAETFNTDKKKILVENMCNLFVTDSLREQLDILIRHMISILMWFTKQNI